MPARDYFPSPDLLPKWDYDVVLVGPNELRETLIRFGGDRWRLYDVTAVEFGVSDRRLKADGFPASLAGVPAPVIDRQF